MPIFTFNDSFQLQYRILSGNNANLVLLNETTGSMTLSPQLNTNVPKLATMEISVSGKFINHFTRCTRSTIVFCDNRNSQVFYAGQYTLYVMTFGRIDFFRCLHKIST